MIVAAKKETISSSNGTSREGLFCQIDNNELDIDILGEKIKESQ